MQELWKRVKSGVWVAGAGFFMTVITIVLQNIDTLHLSPLNQMLVIAVGTGVVSQITKYLNK